MFQKVITSLARALRPIRQRMENRVEEIKFEQRVQDAMRNPGFDQQTQTVKFEYGGQNLCIKVPDIRDYISLNIVSKGTFFDLSDLEALRDLIKPGAIVIDAGSNIGNHALYYAVICGATRVYCFEPQARIFNLLQENIQLNHQESRIIAYQYALGDQPARASASFQDDVVISGHRTQVNYGGLYLKEDAGGAFEVTTLDILLLPLLTRLDYIKLDVQGFEDKVIRGGQELIRKFRPMIQVECMDRSTLNTTILPLMNTLHYRLTRVLEIDYIFEPIR